jgi:hypothetical protein
MQLAGAIVREESWTPHKERQLLPQPVATDMATDPVKRFSPIGEVILGKVSVYRAIAHIVGGLYAVTYGGIDAATHEVYTLAKAILEGREIAIARVELLKLMAKAAVGDIRDADIEQWPDA